MTGFSLFVMFLLLIAVARLAFRRMDMIPALVLAFVSSCLVGGLLQVSADGQGLMALQMLGLALLIAPIAALDASSARRSGKAVLLSSSPAAGMTLKSEPFLRAARHGYAA